MNGAVGDSGGGVEQALEIARRMAGAGIPLFVAPPQDNKIGFALPTGWERTLPDAGTVDSWRPGWALCAVMGHGLDGLDFDFRNGADAQGLNGSMPTSYGATATPSGGMHSFIHSLGTGSHDGVYPGIDVKGGRPDGSGRGFLFLPPTVRASKVDGEKRPYRWVQEPNLTGLNVDDKTGAELGKRILELLGGSRPKAPDGLSPRMHAFFTQRESVAVGVALRTVDRLLAELSAWSPANPKDYRSMLRDVALTIGGYVGGGALDREQAHQRLLEAVSAYWPTPNDDDLLWIAQGLDDGAERAFPVHTAADELLYAQSGGADESSGGDGDDRQEPPWTDYSSLGVEPFDPVWANSDQELAEEVARRTEGTLRYGIDSGTWLVREREHWVERKDRAGWVMSTLARLMPLGETPVPKDVSLRTERHWQALRRAKFLDSAGSSRISAKLTTVMQSRYFGGVELAELDTDPEVLWAGGTAWDLRASLNAPAPAELNPATPHLHTALCAPQERETPLWDQFLEAVWPDPEVRAWALRVLSVSLAGYPDAALPVLYGPERTGKTSMVQLLVQLLGTYGHAADPRLLAGADSTHASVVYALKGRRLSFIDEGPRRGHLAAERLKQLTGGGSLTGNAMRANPVTFNPTHTLVMTTNEEPTVTDGAIRARMRVIPCESDTEMVRRAREAITPAVWRREAPGVLAQMMAQCAGWLADPDTARSEHAPTVLRESVAEMAASQDPVREWVSDCTVPAEPGTPGRALYRSFCSWHEGQAMYRRAPAPTENAFGRTLTDMGYPWTLLGRGNERLRYRPLSVFGGPPGASPSRPPAGTISRSIGEGSEDQSSPPQNPSSDLLFSSFGEDGEDLHTTTTTEKHTYTQKEYIEAISERKRGFSLGDPPLPPHNPPTNRSSPAKESLGTNSGDVLAKTTPLVMTGHEKVTTASLRQEAQKVAERSDKEGISKAEARAALKAERLAAAVISAQGPLTELPAAVDRSGAVTAITEEFAATLLGQCSVLTVDVETSGYPIGHRDYRLKTVQLGNESVAVVLDPVAHAEPIKAALVRATVLHAHSAVADLVPLAVAGLIDYQAGWAKMFDTVIPAKLGDPQSTGSDPGLKKLASAVLRETATAPGADTGREALFKAGGWLTRVKPEHDVSRSGWAQCDPRSEVMLRYAASDVLDTAALATRLPAVPEKILERERLAEAMVSQVSYRGIGIDAEKLAALTAEHTALLAQFGDQVRAFGVENPGSTAQVAEKLAQMGAELPTTPGGRPSAAEHALSVLCRSEGQIGVLAGLVLDYRHSATVLGLFLAPYRQLVERGDGRARPTIYTMGADTGRMTSTRPNIQQLPRAGGIRGIFRADPGHVFISADFSGVELRGAAALSQDPSMRHMIAEEDAGRFDGFHWAVARQAYGPDASKADRYNAKRGVFGCVPLDTEILTQRGWLTHDQVRVGDKTPGRASDGTVRWTPVTGVHVYEDAPLMRIHGGQTWSATTTPGHRWAVTRRRDGGSRGRYFVDEWATTETIGVEHTIHLGGLLDAPGKLNISPDEAALIGWAITDGSVWFAPITGRTAQGADGRRRKATVKLYQAKPEGVAALRKLLDALGLEAGEREIPVGHKRTLISYVWLLPAAPMRELFGRAGLLTEAGFDWGGLETFVLGLSTVARLAFLEAVIAAEGCQTPHGVSVISQNEGLTCDAIELASYLCGYRVTRSVGDRRGNAVNYKLRLSASRVTGQKLRREDAGRAPVWCVSTGFGTWTMRHNGQIMLTGNTFYGGGAVGLSKQIGVTEQEMVVIIDSLKTIAPGYFSWSERMRQAVRAGNTRYESCSGRVIHFDPATPHKAPAYAIQGSCRELLIDALLRWRDTLWGDATIVPIHDELLVMVPAQDADEALTTLVAAMESTLFGVRIKAEPSVPSQFWRDAE